MENVKSFLVRLPEDLLERFDASAKKAGKSRNAAVVQAMENSLVDVAQVISDSISKAATKGPSPERIAEISERLRKQARDIAPCPHKYRVQKGEKTVCPACGDER